MVGCYRQPMIYHSVSSLFHACHLRTVRTFSHLWGERLHYTGLWTQGEVGPSYQPHGVCFWQFHEKTAHWQPAEVIEFRQYFLFVFPQRNTYLSSSSCEISSILLRLCWDRKQTFSQLQISMFQPEGIGLPVQPDRPVGDWVISSSYKETSRIQTTAVSMRRNTKRTTVCLTTCTTICCQTDQTESQSLMMLNRQIEWRTTWRGSQNAPFLIMVNRETLNNCLLVCECISEKCGFCHFPQTCTYGCTRQFRESDSPNDQTNRGVTLGLYLCQLFLTGGKYSLTLLSSEIMSLSV